MNSNTTLPNPEMDSAVDSAALRFLTFTVGDRLYALPAQTVAQVIRVPAIARVPQSPVALLGIANLRGTVTPVASLRGLLEMPLQPVESRTRAIVLDVGVSVALVVDSVESLVVVDSDRIETRQAELSALPGERIVGALRSGSEQAIAKIIDIKALLDTAFIQRSQPSRAAPRTSRLSDREQLRAEIAPTQVLVTFEVAGQEFALDIDDVQEILPSPSALTAVPHVDESVLGMTSHRASLLPLLSLRTLLGFEAGSVADRREKVIVLKLGDLSVGLVADRARAILDVPVALLDPLPEVIAARAVGEARVKAIYRGDGGRRLVSILEPEHLFREDIMQRLIGDATAEPKSLPQADLMQHTDVQFLVFRLGDDEFGLPIEFVDEVAVVPDRITRVPKTPKFLDGVVNLRGSVLPVVDQRRRFDMPPGEQMQGRRLIVVRTERHRAGLIVDSVSEVLRTTASAVGPAPNLTDATARLVQGVINLEQTGRIVLLLDPTELLTQAERGLLDAFQKKTAQAHA